MSYAENQNRGISHLLNESNGLFGLPTPQRTSNCEYLVFCVEIKLNKATVLCFNEIAPIANRRINGYFCLLIFEWDADRCLVLIGGLEALNGDRLVTYYRVDLSGS